MPDLYLRLTSGAQCAIVDSQNKPLDAIPRVVRGVPLTLDVRFFANASATATMTAAQLPDGGWYAIAFHSWEDGVAPRLSASTVAVQTDGAVRVSFAQTNTEELAALLDNRQGAMLTLEVGAKLSSAEMAALIAQCRMVADNRGPDGVPEPVQIDYYTKAQVNALLGGKQDELTAGDNISIVGSTISATIPEGQQSDWAETSPNAVSYIWNKPNLSVYATVSSLESHTGNAGIHVTAADKDAWNAKITAPAAPVTGQYLRKTETGWDTSEVTAPAWGSIGGTLSSQTDLQEALDAKQGTIADLPAIRANQTGITTLMAADTAVALADNSVNAHTPTASCAYTLPAVADATKTHRITLYVKHTATTILASFKDSVDTAITPIGGAYTPAANEVVKYECTWIDALSQWTVEVVSQKYGAITQKGGKIAGELIVHWFDSGSYVKLSRNEILLTVSNGIYFKAGVGYFKCTGKPILGNSNANTAGGFSILQSNGTVKTPNGFATDITAIPSATSACTITEGVSTHAPSAPATYTLSWMRFITVASVDYIYSSADSGTGYYAWKSGTTKKYTASLTPAVGDMSYTNTALTAGAAAITGNVQTVTHEVVLYLDLSATASFVFKDADGNDIVAKKSFTPAVGDKVTALCRWEFGAWQVYLVRTEEASA